MVQLLVWLSDTHLNVLPAERYQRFITAVSLASRDAILITGDIAEPPVTEKFLKLLATETSCPIYFVLGNHDYYDTTVVSQRILIEQVCHTHPRLHFLTMQPPFKLTPRCMLLGIDAWPDGRSSDFMKCPRQLLDKDYIQDFIFAKDSKVQLLTQLQQLADADIATLAAQLAVVVESNVKQLLVMTHVPPWHETVAITLSPRDQTELALFTCLSLGNILHDFALSQPQLQIVHIAGHVHHQSSYQITPNYRVMTAAATVGKPYYQYLDLEALFSV